MKRILTALTAILLTAAMLAGCAAPVGFGAYNTPAAAQKELTRGTIEGSVYTSDYSDLTFTASGGWVYATEDELKQMMSSQLSKYGEQISDDMLKNRIVYDMVIKNPSNGTFVSIAYMNLALLAGEYGLNDGGASLTEDDLLDSVKETLSKMKDYNSSAGDIIDMKLGPQNFRALRTELAGDGSVMYYCVRKMDKFMLYIIINIVGGGDIDEIAKCFS